MIACTWAQVLPFSEGRAVVQNKQGRYGYIDKSGNSMGCRWKAAKPYSGGTAEVQDSQDNWLVIDKMGNVVKR